MQATSATIAAFTRSGRAGFSLGWGGAKPGKNNVDRSIVTSRLQNAGRRVSAGVLNGSYYPDYPEDRAVNRYDFSDAQKS